MASASSNVGDGARGASESTAFDIDNTPPVIAVTSVNRQPGRLAIAFEVRDENSTCRRLGPRLTGTVAGDLSEGWHPGFTRRTVRARPRRRHGIARRIDPGPPTRSTTCRARAATSRRRPTPASDQAVDDGIATEVEGASGFARRLPRDGVAQCNLHGRQVE